MKTITAHDLRRRLDQDHRPLVVDVLPADHYASEHVPGATNVPLGRDDFIESVEDVAEGRDQSIVVYCANTECDLSPKAARALENAGFQDVSDFEGGIEEWKAAGFPVTDD